MPVLLQTNDQDGQDGAQKTAGHLQAIQAGVEHKVSGPALEALPQVCNGDVRYFGGPVHGFTSILCISR